MSAASIPRSLPAFDAASPVRRDAAKADARIERPFELPAERPDVRRDDAPAEKAPARAAPDKTAPEKAAPSKASAGRDSKPEAAPAKEAGVEPAPATGPVGKPAVAAGQGEAAVVGAKESESEDRPATAPETAAPPQPVLPASAPLFLAQIESAPVAGKEAGAAAAAAVVTGDPAAAKAVQGIALPVRDAAIAGADVMAKAGGQPAVSPKAETKAEGEETAVVAPVTAVPVAGEAKPAAQAAPAAAVAVPVAAASPSPVAAQPHADAAANGAGKSKPKGDAAGGEAPSATQATAEAAIADKAGAASSSGAAQASPEGRPGETVQQAAAPVADMSAPVVPTPSRGLPALPDFDAALQVGQPPQASAPETGRPTPIHVVPIEIGMQALAGNKRFDIRLDPGELGRVDVRLEISDEGDVSARLTVDRVETLHMLQRDARTLERAFEQAGLKTSDSGVQINLRDPSDQSGARQGGQQNEDGARSRKLWAASGEDVAVPAEIVPLRRAARLGGVDLSI